MSLHPKMCLFTNCSTYHRLTFVLFVIQFFLLTTQNVDLRNGFPLAFSCLFPEVTRIYCWKVSYKCLYWNFTSVYNIDNDCSEQLPTLYFLSIQPYAWIHILLSELESHKAFGLDGIPSHLLKELTTHIAPVLAFIITASLHQGKLPLDMEDCYCCTNMQERLSHWPYKL